MAKVRGEDVVILEENVQNPAPGVLGAVYGSGVTLVRYPDGEEGYVKPSQIDKDDA